MLSCLFHLINLLNPDFNCSRKLLSSSVDKVTNGTYSFVSVILNVAFHAETFTPKTLFETFVALSSVAATSSIFALINIAQCLDQVKVKDTSQLNNGTLKLLQKMLTCFNGTAFSTFPLFPLFSLSISPSLTITFDL